MSVGSFADVIDGQPDQHLAADAGAVKLVRAAMITENFCDQRKAKPAAARLGGDERVKDMRQKLFGDAGGMVLHTALERQLHFLLRARDGEAFAVTVGGA